MSKAIYTIDKISDAELISRILGVSPNSEVCTRIAESISCEGDVQAEELLFIAKETKSIGTQRLARIEAAIELGRRALRARSIKEVSSISDPDDVFDLMRPMMVGLQREHFFALLLNTKNHVKKIVEISIGSLNASIVHPRELFKEAVKASAASIVVVHNHPSGDPIPSGADLQLTRRIVKAGDVLGIEVLDHVVIGSDTFESIRELGEM